MLWIISGLFTLSVLTMFYGSHSDWGVIYFLDPYQTKELKRRWKGRFGLLKGEMSSLDELSESNAEEVKELKRFFIHGLKMLLARAEKMQSNEEGK